MASSYGSATFSVDATDNKRSRMDVWDENTLVGMGKTWTETPVWRTAFFSRKLEQVVSEEDRHLVVVKQLVALCVFTVAAVKDVERAVVFGGVQVLCVVLHLHLHRVAIVVLATLELLVAVLAFEALQGPFLAGRPVFLAVQKDHGLVGPLEALDELLRTELEGVNPLHRVLEGAQQNGV